VASDAWRAFNQQGFRFFPRAGSPVVQRIDPPGLLSATAVTGVTQWFWQYDCRNLLLFERDAATYLFVPECPDASAVWDWRRPAITLDRLPGRRWRMRAPGAELASRYACGFALAQDARKYLSMFPSIAEARDSFGEEVDLAPLLHADLQRLAKDPDERAFGSAIALLDVLATHRGWGSQELVLPAVHFGADAEAAFAKLPGDALPEVVRRELLAYERGAEVESGALRWTALTEKTEKIDGTSGGNRSEVAVVSLTVWDTGWRFERATLWSETEPGIELS
jgi:hypothetical protein